MAATVWRGRLAFGMVAIPVRLYKAARRERIRFRQVYRPPDPSARRGPVPVEDVEPEEPELPEPPAVRGKTAAAPFRAAAPVPAHDEPSAEEESRPVMRVQRAAVSGPEEEPIQNARILKGYELEKDRYAVFRPEEVAALRPRTSREVAIGEFVKLAEIDPVFFDASYYVAPDRGGEKPYALLFRTLQQSGYAALGSLAMHGREHAAVIRPGSHGLILHTLFFANEVHAEEEYRADPQFVTPKELELATMLVGIGAAPFNAAKLKDPYEERLRALVESRAGAPLVGEQGAPAAPPAPAGDILEALRRSIEAARKPPARETAGKAATKRKGRRSAG